MLKNQAGSLRSNLDKIISNMMLLFSSEIVLPEIPSQKAGSINPRELPHQLGLTAIEKEPEREETASGSTQKQIETEGTMEQQPTNQAAKDVDATQ